MDDWGENRREGLDGESSLDPPPGLSAEGERLEWLPWEWEPRAAVLGFHPISHGRDPRCHPSSHWDAPGSPGVFPCQFLSG